MMLRADPAPGPSTRAAEKHPAERKPCILEGTRVVDFTWYIAGPICTALLASYGAEVIRVESTTNPDGIRNIYDPVPAGKSGLNVNGEFNKLNHSKMSITLNLNHPRAVQTVKRLIAVSDVVVDNFAGGVMERWGLGYEELARVRPDIVVAAMPGMGLTGPHAGFRGFGADFQAVAGIDSVTGFPHRPPVGAGIAYPDFSCNPYHAAVAILAALHHRQKTGQGQFIELRQHESIVCFLGAAILDYTANGRVQTRVGNRSPSGAPHGVYRCKGVDRWCAIDVADDQWRAFCNAIGNPSWTKSERFATALSRKQNEEELDRLVEEWTAQKTAEDVMRTLQAAGVAAGVVQNAEDLLVHDPQLEERGFYRYTEHPEAGATVVLGSSFKLSGASAQPPRHAPLLGQHNDYVYQHVLGMKEEEVNEAMVEGAIA